MKAVLCEKGKESKNFSFLKAKKWVISRDFIYFRDDSNHVIISYLLSENTFVILWFCGEKEKNGQNTSRKYTFCFCNAPFSFGQECHEPICSLIQYKSTKQSQNNQK